MKITQIAQGTGSSGGEPADIGRSASPTRISRAKAVAEGKVVETQAPVKEEAEQRNVRKIKMKTNRTVHRDIPVEEPVTAAPVAVEGNIPDQVEPDQAAPVENKPIDPQVALQARIKRAVQTAVQEKDTEIAALKKQLEAPKVNPDEVSVADLQANPLAILSKHGVTYDQLTEAILSQQDTSPAYARLQAEIESLKEGLKNQNQTQADRDIAARTQLLSQMERDALKIVSSGDEFEAVRDRGAVKDVIRLIDKNFDATGEVMDVEEALQLIENELIEEGIRFAKLKKVQSKLGSSDQQIAQPQNTNTVRPMRTLTSRDNAGQVSNRRDRAINAFYGRK